eukprot:15431461-Alexandrium_andersonii.AAC.1
MVLPERAVAGLLGVAWQQRVGRGHAGPVPPDLKRVGVVGLVAPAAVVPEVCETFDCENPVGQRAHMLPGQGRAVPVEGRWANQVHGDAAPTFAEAQHALRLMAKEAGGPARRVGH